MVLTAVREEAAEMLLEGGGRELIGEMIIGASRGSRVGCLYVVSWGTTATPREGEFIGDSLMGTEGEDDGESGGDKEELLSLSDDGEEHSSPSGFDTLRFTLALLF